MYQRSISCAMSLVEGGGDIQCVAVAEAPCDQEHAPEKRGESDHMLYNFGNFKLLQQVQNQ